MCGGSGMRVEREREKERQREREGRADRHTEDEFVSNCVRVTGVSQCLCVLLALVVHVVMYIFIDTSIVSLTASFLWPRVSGPVVKTLMALSIANSWL